MPATLTEETYDYDLIKERRRYLPSNYRSTLVTEIGTTKIVIGTVLLTIFD